MNSTSRPQEPPPRPTIDEADIGSGEKTPGQHETEEMIRQIPPLPKKDAPPDDAKPTPPR
jgi:hypothetical protein